MTLLSNLVFKKFLYFHFCLTFSGKFFDFPKKLCLSKMQFTSPNENVFGFFFFGKGNVIIALKLRSKSHRTLDWIFCAWLSKLHSKSLEEFRDNICFWSKELFKFIVLWHKTYRIFDGFFFQFRPNTFLSVNGNCLRMVFFDVFFGFYIFLNFGPKCFDFAHEISTSLSKLLPNSLEEIVEDNFFQEKNNLSFIFGLWPKFLLTLFNDFSAGLPKVHLALLD